MVKNRTTVLPMLWKPVNSHSCAVINFPTSNLCKTLHQCHCYRNSFISQQQGKQIKQNQKIWLKLNSNFSPSTVHVINETATSNPWRLASLSFASFLVCLHTGGKSNKSIHSTVINYFISMQLLWGQKSVLLLNLIYNSSTQINCNFTNDFVCIGAGDSHNIACCCLFSRTNWTQMWSSLFGP